MRVATCIGTEVAEAAAQGGLLVSDLLYFFARSMPRVGDFPVPGYVHGFECGGSRIRMTSDVMLFRLSGRCQALIVLFSSRLVRTSHHPLPPSVFLSWVLEKIRDGKTNTPPDSSQPPLPNLCLPSGKTLPL